MFNMNEEKIYASRMEYMPFPKRHNCGPDTVLVYHRILWARPNAKKQDGRESLLGIS